MEDASNKRAGIIGTVIFHLLLLLFFLTTVLTQPDPLPEQESASIMLGWVDEGSGDDSPSPTPVVSAETVPTPTEPDPVVAETVVEQVVETQTDNSVAIVKPKETKPKETKPEKPKEDPKPPKPSDALQNAFNSWDDSSEGGGNGDSEKEGSEGKPEGKPDGKGVFGNGGNGWSLVGRDYKGGIITEKPEEAGIIVIAIVVGKNGKVISTRYEPNGSTSVSMDLINIARKAAKKATFNEDHTANVQQTGLLTFNFKLK